MSQIDFERYNPFRRPDWRWERVLEIVDRRENGRPGRTTKRDDTYIKGLRNFILRYRNGDEVARTQLGYENPGLLWAYQIFEARQDDAASRLAEIVEARILARQTDEQVADELHTLPQTVLWYEQLFFNVRDRLDGHDWILNHVLFPAVTRSREAALAANAEAAAPVPNPQRPVSEPFFDATIKFFAYFGGPLMLDYVLSGFQRGNLARSREEVGSWFDKHWTTRIKHRSAAASATFEVNRYSVMELFNCHASIMQIQKTQDDDAEKQSQMNKSIKAMMTNMGWAYGKDGEDTVAGTPIEPYDDGAVELRDDEVLLMHGGGKPDTIHEGLEKFTMPEPRRVGQEDRQHANANA
jgi:hypothetical protein